MSKVIMGVQLQERIEKAVKVQELLSKYGCYITTRVGLHSSPPNSCSPRGLILLEFVDDGNEEAQDLEQELAGIEGVSVKKMVF